MNTYADDAPEVRTFTTTRKWLSENDDRAWAEKLYLWYIPVFFLISGITSRTGLSISGNWGNLGGGLLVWLPFCVLLPLWLRRNHPLPITQQWWFKFQLYLMVVIFFLTYFGTEYFFDVLGMRYKYDNVSWYFDSVLLGPDQATALAQHKRVPIGMYPISVGFFTVYHIGAIVMMRKLYRIGLSFGAAAGRLGFALGLLASALYDPVWRSAVGGPKDFAIAAAGFAGLSHGIALRTRYQFFKVYVNAIEIIFGEHFQYVIDQPIFLCRTV